MFRPIWLRQLRRRFRAPTTPHRPIFRPCLEVLEDRMLLSGDIFAGDISTIVFQPPTPNSATVNQPVKLTANVMAMTGQPINVGLVDFEQVNSDGSDTILVSGVQIPNATATAQYTFTNPGSYALIAHYEGDSTAGWAPSDSTRQIETVQASAQTATQTTVTPVTLSFSPDQQQVNLSATVDDLKGNPIPSGSLNFTFQQNQQPVPGAKFDTPNPAQVSDGSATVKLLLPPGLAAGRYLIEGGYSDGTNGTYTSSGNTASLTINPAPTNVGTVNVNPSQVTFSEDKTPVQVSTTVTSGGNPVSEGNITFTIASLGISTGLIHVNPDGTVQATLLLPSGAEVGAYTVQAAYSDDNPGNFGPSNSPNGPANLTINPVVPTSGNGNTGGSGSNNSATVSQLLDDIANLEGILSGNDTNAINAQLAVVSNDIGQLQTSAATESAADRMQTDSALFGAGIQMILDAASVFLTNPGESAALSIALEGFAAAEPALVDLVLTELSMVALALQP